MTARDFAHLTLRRVRHTRRWREAKTKSIARFKDRLKIILLCANAGKCRTPNLNTENIGFGSRADAREKACQAPFFDAAGSFCRVDTR